METTPAPEPVSTAKKYPIPPETPKENLDKTPYNPRKIPEWKLRNAFCPAKALPKFPYSYIFPRAGEVARKAAYGYFDGGRIWLHSWDVYYLPIPAQISEQRLLLIPAQQVKLFLDIINYELGCDLGLTTNAQHRLVLFFDGDDGTPKPVYLGRSDSREALDELERRIPRPEDGDDDWTKTSAPEAFDAFRKKFHDGIMTYKRRRTKSRHPASQLDISISEISKKHPNQIIPTRGLYQLKSYLGLRPPINEGGHFAGDEKFASVEVSEPVRWETLGNPIFLSVDVEWNERNQTQVTEIGISSLDTVDIHAIPPGLHGENWVKYIKSAHLRTVEYKNFCNTQFVMGCPSMFLFGESELILDSQIGTHARWFFSPPYDGTQDLDRADLPEHKRATRTIVLVGHEPYTDLKILAERCKIFEPVENRPGKVVSEVMDTKILYACLREEKNFRGLENMLFELGFQPKYLHNAGNDARYTLEALIRIALVSAGKVQSPKIDAKTDQKVVEEAEAPDTKE
ncbi:hypothetical protein PMG11_02457 [Penicillium brasilianum]|uniref:Gfd2/YDR514C-like C-terminal domain-containing protein n=1 Tax=Penicillium brasilianum TaxID=104259 RepID=A0A0F7TI61_PENBI|nr:hypothetical protein PMG11_02457 [Penicillium brasilianum]